MNDVRLSAVSNAIGVDVSTISRFENGERILAADTKAKYEEFIVSYSMKNRLNRP